MHTKLIRKMIQYKDIQSLIEIEINMVEILKYALKIITVNSFRNLVEK